MKAVKAMAWIVTGALVAYFGVAFYNSGLWELGVLAAPSRGTPASRPTIWLNDPAITHSSIPNVVILAVMEAESGGDPNAGTWQCSIGPDVDRPCGSIYPFGLVGTVASHVGLLGVPNGPRNPHANIAAGVVALEKDLAQYHYLEYALEAYDGARAVGQKAPASARAFAQQVLANVRKYEAAPMVLAWSTAGELSASIEAGNTDASIGVWKASKGSPFSIFVSAEAPFGMAFDVPWAPGRRVSGKDLLIPETVWAFGCSAAGNVPFVHVDTENLFSKTARGTNGDFVALIQWTPKEVASIDFPVVTVVYQGETTGGSCPMPNRIPSPTIDARTLVISQ